MTDYEVLTELMKWHPDDANYAINRNSDADQLVIKSFRNGFKAAIEFIENQAYQAADYEFAIWHAKETIGEK